MNYLFKSLKETRSKLACSSLNKQVECYFECLLFILEKCNSTEDAAYCTSLIDSCVSKTMNKNYKLIYKNILF